jgi:hypothetical protein
MTQFMSVIEHQQHLEKVVQWLDEVMEHCLVMREEEAGLTREDSTREFVLRWGFCGQKLIQGLTMQSMPSFGKYLHLLYGLNEQLIHRALLSLMRL